MGVFAVPEIEGLDRAVARDRALAEGLMARLLADGRRGHPATRHLELFLSDGTEPVDHVHLAAVAFEAAARLRVGQIAGAMARRGRRHPALRDVLKDRRPTDWESASRRPYREVDWRRVIARAAEDARQDRFRMPMTIPGAHLFVTLGAQAADRGAFVDLLMGDAPRDDTLDAVATSGNFLAQALPGYQDIDLLFRQHRERLLARGSKGD
jgi:hypothetical protein